MSWFIGAMSQSYDIVINTVKGADHNCVNHDISKSEAIRLLENSVLDNCEYI